MCSVNGAVTSDARLLLESFDCTERLTGCVRVAHVLHLKCLPMLYDRSDTELCATENHPSDIR
jgi:hypothetical protein